MSSRSISPHPSQSDFFQSGLDSSTTTSSNDLHNYQSSASNHSSTNSQASTSSDSSTNSQSSAPFILSNEIETIKLQIQSLSIFIEQSFSQLNDNLNSYTHLLNSHTDKLSNLEQSTNSLLDLSANHWKKTLYSHPKKI